MKPLLKPTHRPLWRDERTVQLGLHERAVVVSDLSPPTARLLGVLDGSREDAELRAGGEPEATLLDLLAGSRCTESADAAGPEHRLRLAPERALLGLLYPDDGAASRVLAARGRTRVLILGGGRVGATVAQLLAASGLGRVTVSDATAVTAADACPGGLHESDAGLRRGAAATALAVRALAPTLGAGPPDVAILCPDGPAPPDPQQWRPLHAAGVALLVASVVETTAVVGPFTRPYGVCCPGCVSLHRTDRDPAWPLVERQLLDPARVPASTAGAALAVATAAAAVAEVLAWVDGSADPAAGYPAGPSAGPASEYATLELPLPGWRWRRRPWGPHPACSCVNGAPARGLAATGTE